MTLRCRWLGGLGLLTMLAGSACIGSLPPLPALLQAPGIKTEATPLRKEQVVSLAGSALSSRIMQITSGPDQDLIVVAENGLRWIDAAGGTTRDLILPAKMFRHSLQPLPDGQTGIGGFSSRPNAILMFDLSGQEVLRIGLGPSYDFPEFANVMGGSEREVVVPGRLGVRVFSLRGTLIGTLSSSTYATIKTVVQADDDPEYEIAFVTTSLRAGPVEALVMNADGTTVSRWNDAEGGWLSFVPELDDRSLWGLTADGFTAWDAQGQRVQTFAAPDVSALRYVTGAKFKHHTVLIASGGGYSNVSALCVFDNSRRLVFQEVYSSRIYSAFADRDADHFYVGVDDAVVKYTLATSASSAGTVR